MFGRRRHVAPVVAAPAPQLTDDQIFDLVHEQIAATIGERGEWTLTRRTEEDSDTLFHGMISRAVATNVMDALRAAREQLATDATAAAEATVDERAGDHVASVDEAPASSDDERTEPAAFSWSPAPITVWTDLKKPVTGEIALIREKELVA